MSKAGARAAPDAHGQAGGRFAPRTALQGAGRAAGATVCALRKTKLVVGASWSLARPRRTEPRSGEREAERFEPANVGRL